MKTKKVMAMFIAMSVLAVMGVGCGSEKNLASIGAGYGIGTISLEALELADEGTGTVEAIEGTALAEKPQETAAEPEKEADAKPAAAQPAADAKAGNEAKPAQNENKPAADNTKPANETKPAQDNPKPVSTAPSQPEPPKAPEPAAPAHEHVWHEHTAEKQEWVPNIVTVDDYETQKVPVGSEIHCNCGAVLPGNAEALEEHATAHILAGEDDGHWNVVIYEEQQVKVGSHEEDHGYYKTVTYVDYHYCDCGATK